MLPNDEILSRTISFLRFPLIVAVVMIHADLSQMILNGTSVVDEGAFPLFKTLAHVFSYELPGTAVPMFFFISGFLFFYRSGFSWRIYGTKLKRRARSLLIPYLLWNVAVFVLFLLTQIFLPSLASGQGNLRISEYTFTDWLRLFWDHSDGHPICYQFWFLRDLMVIILLSPVIFALIRGLQILAPLLLGAIWALDIVPSVPGFSTSAVFYFTFGAWFSLTGRNFAVCFEKYRPWLAMLFAVLIVVSTLAWHFDYDIPLLHPITIVIELMAAAAWTARGIRCEKLKANHLLSDSSFWLYACHVMPIVLLMKCWLAFVRPLNEYTLIAGYMLIPVIIVVLGVASYALLLRVAPRFTKLVTGGR